MMLSEEEMQQLPLREQLRDNTLPRAPIRGVPGHNPHFSYRI